MRLSGIQKLIPKGESETLEMKRSTAVSPTPHEAPHVTPQVVAMLEAAEIVSVLGAGTFDDEIIR